MSDMVFRYGGSFPDQPFIPKTKTGSVAALPCPKCGGKMGKQTYCKGRFDTMIEPHGSVPLHVGLKPCGYIGEHLYQTCGTCGYESVGPCLDAKIDGKPEGETP